MSTLDQRQKAKERVRDARVQTVAALDVGTSKVTCIILRWDGESPNMRVIGMGDCGGVTGVRGGTVADIEALERAIRTAVDTAERAANVSVSEVVVSYSGGGLRSQLVTGAASLDGEPIGRREVRRAILQAMEGVRCAGQDLLHANPIDYALDDGCSVRDPRGMLAERLTVGLHALAAPAAATRNLVVAVERAHLAVDKIVAAPYASALATLVEDEMQLGSLCVDMGAGATKLAIYVDGGFAFADTIALGGMRVTADIAQGLGATFIAAERAKLAFGAVESGDLGGGDHDLIEIEQVGERGELSKVQTTRGALTAIIRPRMEEIFEIARDRLTRTEAAASAARVVLTGGASQLPGARALAQKVFGRPVRLGRPLRVDGMDEAHAAAYATAIGLARWKLDRPSDALRSQGPRPAAEQEALRSGLIARAMAWVKENL
jgi:cell division protein FtsA